MTGNTNAGTAAAASAKDLFWVYDSNFKNLKFWNINKNVDNFRRQLN